MRKTNLRLKLIGLILCSFMSCFVSSLSVQLKPAKSEQNTNLKNSDENSIDTDLINYYNSQYTGTLVLGSHQQTFNLIFDTSSPWLWVLNSTSNNPRVGSKFDCITSSTCRYVTQSGEMMKVKYFAYSKGSNVEGFVAQDYVAFPSSKTFYQSFLVMSEVHADLIAGFGIDGICGLSPREDIKFPSLLTQLRVAGLIEKKMFSLYLNNNPEAYEEQGSEIFFGGVNPKKYVGNFINVTTKDSPFWEADLDKIFLSAGKKSSMIEKTATYAVFDSGVSTIKMLEKDFFILVKKFKEDFELNCGYTARSKNFACACPSGNIEAFPNITFVFSSQVLVVPPSQYLLITKESCILLIEKIDTSPLKGDDDDDSSVDTNNYIVLGTPFLRNYYTVFDVDNRRISFAQPVKPKKNLLNTFELIYIIFGSFIGILFCVLIGYAVKIWANMHNSKKGSVDLDNILGDRTSSEVPYKTVN